MLTYSPLVTTDFAGTGYLIRSYFEDLKNRCAKTRDASRCRAGRCIIRPASPPGTISSRVADQGSIQYFAQNWEKPDSAPRVVWKRVAMMLALFSW